MSPLRGPPAACQRAHPGTRYPVVGVKPLAHSADGDSMSLADRASRVPVFVRPRSDALRRRATDSVVSGPIGARPFRREGDGWLDRWMETVADLARLKDSHPMLDAVIDEQDGRRIRIGDRWLFDFASCNYQGFDLDREIIDAVPAYLDRWGTHPSWSRLLGRRSCCSRQGSRFSAYTTTRRRSTATTRPLRRSPSSAWTGRSSSRRCGSTVCRRTRRPCSAARPPCR